VTVSVTVTSPQVTRCRLGGDFAFSNGRDWLGAAQDRADAGNQQPLAEWLGDIIVGAHRQAQRFVELVVLAGKEDHRDCALLAQAAQQFEPVHLGHLDVEHREIGRILHQRLQRAFSVRIDSRQKAFGLERDRHRSEDVAVVVDQRDCCGHRAAGVCGRCIAAMVRPKRAPAQSNDSGYPLSDNVARIDSHLLGCLRLVNKDRARPSFRC